VKDEIPLPTAEEIEAECRRNGFDTRGFTIQVYRCQRTGRPIATLTPVMVLREMTVTISVADEADPPSYLPMREPLSPRIPDLNPDVRERHRDGSVRPPNCRCVEECWTDEDDAAWRKEWREST
jgi:hypothetical protein